jgi:phosphoribosylaminoimidazole-succinocarboxamide synthase
MRERGAMKHIYEGKTKTVFELDDGNYLLKFKDDVTGKDGVFDPGANQVELSIEGMGIACLRMTDYYYRLLRDAGVRTHYISADIGSASMTVRKAKPIGLGLEVVCRFRATGSFIRRYGLYAKEGQPLDALVEFTLKDDERQDPLIIKDALAELSILGADDYESIRMQTKRICGLIKDDLARKGLELYDIKIEFGISEDNGEVLLIDEISAGNMRVYKDGKNMEPLEFMRLALA